MLRLTAALPRQPIHQQHQAYRLGRRLRRIQDSATQACILALLSRVQDRQRLRGQKQVSAVAQALRRFGSTQGWVTG